jgi:hypothetical protein
MAKALGMEVAAEEVDLLSAEEEVGEQLLPKNWLPMMLYRI